MTGTEQHLITTITPADLETVWWTFSYVVLPAIAGCYGLTLAMLKWVWGELKEIRTNELHAIDERLRNLEQKTASLPK